MEGRVRVVDIGHEVVQKSVHAMGIDLRWDGWGDVMGKALRALQLQLQSSNVF